MKIAITADNHLRTREEHPARWLAFENILSQLDAEKIRHLIIAGDLYDKEYDNYSEFDQLINGSSLEKCYIIPGNHDPGIRQSQFGSDKIQVFTETTPMPFEEGEGSFVFVPYIIGKSMGTEIASAPNLEPGKWVLIGHGDYIDGRHEPNPYEKGIYMPLSRKDIGARQPAKAILGHIHIPSDLSGKVVYTGSPCGLDINETGRRRYLIFDTLTYGLTEKAIDTDVLFCQGEVFVFPGEKEEEGLQKEIDALIEKWDLKEEEFEKAQIRVKITGITSDKNKLAENVKKYFEKFKWHKDEGPDLDNVAAPSESEDMALAEQTLNRIKEMELPQELHGISRMDIQNAALKLLIK